MCSRHNFWKTNNLKSLTLRLIHLFSSLCFLPYFICFLPFLLFFLFLLNIFSPNSLSPTSPTSLVSENTYHYVIGSPFLSKSALIPIGEAPNLHQLAQFFGCGVDFLPSTYLGLPLGASYKCKSVWEPVVEKFQRRLAGWKSKLLSKRGRLTLLQSALWSIPIYFMSLFTIPASIPCQLEKIMRDLQWSNNEAGMEFH